MNLSNHFAGLKSFFALWASQAVSTMGSSMTSFALIIWAYERQGTASSVALLAVCSFLPSVLLSFLAGAVADRWDKKKLMLACDSVAAIGTLSILFLLVLNQLQIWHLYLVNFVLGLMNAFQIPVSTVAVTLLTPESQYTRVGGLQAFSNSLVTMLTPALATAVLSFFGLKAVLLLDLASFAAAFVTLAFFIRIPRCGKALQKKAFTLKSCLEGLGFLKKHRPILSLILFFAFVNLLASMSGNGIMPAMVLARSGNDQAALAMVSTAIGAGSIVGSVLVTLLPPPKRRMRVIFSSCAISFFICDIFWGIGQTTWVWVTAAAAGNLPLPFLNANLSAIMRTKVPLEMQGRVFSARDTLQYFMIPVGYLTGGFLADRVFEPFMTSPSAVQGAISSLIGDGKGAGIALLFLLTGIIGTVASLLCLSNKEYHSLEK